MGIQNPKTEQLETGQPNRSATPLPRADMAAWQLVAQQAAQITPQLTDLIKQFWGVSVRLKFFSTSLQNHYYWQQEDCHVSQLVLGEATQSTEPANAALLKISDAACAALLGKVLGAKHSGQKPFRLKQMSPLEAAILNDFSRDLLGNFMKTLLKKTQTTSKDVVNLIWVVQVLDSEPSAESKPILQFKETFECGKIILSVPPQCLRLPEELPAAQTQVPESFFYEVKQEVRVAIGSTRLPLSELHQLERGDWVVLEQSDINRMALIALETGEALSFSAEIKNQQRLMVPYTQELARMETQTGETQMQQAARQNLWDNLLIEVNAEFAPVKLPLQQLKQMSEGLVVEVGDLVNNQICLQVEGKTLAWGELIIVGDKFGVRVTQVEAAEAIPGGQAQSSALATTESTEAVAKTDNDDDLDNFLNDDFNDEEEW